MNVLVAIYSPFVSWCIPAAEFERLRTWFPEHTFVRADSDEEVAARIADADVIFGARVRPDQLAAARRLRWIHSPSAGVGAMLFPEMVASRVTMSNSRGNSAGAIAEHVIAVTLALFRGLPLAWRRQTERAWAQNEFNAGIAVRRLADARVLVVGYGSIGGEVGRLAGALGATIVGIRRSATALTAPTVVTPATAATPGTRPAPSAPSAQSEPPAPPAPSTPPARSTAPLPGTPPAPETQTQTPAASESGGRSAQPASITNPAHLHAELPRADVVVLSAPQTPETVHMIGARELALMKEDSVLVNVSRGGLVDEAALARALETGPMRGAALDVFEHEPLAPDSPLWSRPNVLITPHVSGFHARYWSEATALFAENLRRFAEARPLLNLVDKSAGY